MLRKCIFLILLIVFGPIAWANSMVQSDLVVSGGWIDFVHPNSSAGKLGIQVGDFVVSINGRYMGTDSEIMRILEGVDSGAAVVVLRAGERCRPKSCRFNPPIQAIQPLVANPLPSKQTSGEISHLQPVWFYGIPAQLSEGGLGLGYALHRSLDPFATDQKMKLAWILDLEIRTEEIGSKFRNIDSGRMISEATAGLGLQKQSGPFFHMLSIQLGVFGDQQGVGLTRVTFPSPIDTVGIIQKNSGFGLKVEYQPGHRWDSFLGHLKGVVRMQTQSLDYETSSDIPLIEKQVQWKKPVQLEYGFGVAYIPYRQWIFALEILHHPELDGGPVMKFSMGKSH